MYEKVDLSHSVPGFSKSAAFTARSYINALPCSPQFGLAYL